jgi:hypothetical protein
LAAATGKPNVIIFDPVNQYSAFPNLIPSEIEEWLEDDGTGIVRYAPGRGQVPDAFDALMETLDGGVWEWGDYVLIIDEASYLQNAHWMHPALDRLVRQAPQDIVVIQTMHRPADAHMLVRSLATDYFWFFIDQARNLEAVRESWGDDVAEIVAHLPVYHVLHFWVDVGGVRRWAVWDDPSVWYVPIGID